MDLRGRMLSRFVFSVILISLLFAAGTQADPVPRKVGIITALTGPMAVYGTAVRNGAVLADEEKDKAERFEFLVEDDQFDVKNSVSIAKKFLAVNRVSALIVFGSGNSMAVAPLAEQARVPMIALATLPEITAGREFVLRHFASPLVENEAVVAEVKRLGYRTVAIVSSFQDAMLALRDQFMQGFDGRILFSEEVHPAEREFRTIASRIASLGPEAVYLPVVPGQVGVLASQIRGAGFKGDFFGVHGHEDPGELKTARGALENSWFVSINVIRDSAYLQRYVKRFGSEPATGAANSYDVASMLISCGERGPLMACLRNQGRILGVMGEYELKSDGSFDVPVQLKRIAGGRVTDY